MLLLDSDRKQLVFVPKSEWPEIPQRMKPVTLETAASEAPSAVQIALLRASDEFFAATGSAVAATARLAIRRAAALPRRRWGCRFLAHYLRLVGGVSAWVYLILAGLITGFTVTYFTFRFLPFRLYTTTIVDRRVAGGDRGLHSTGSSFRSWRRF